MPDRRLSVAVGDYGRTRPLIDGDLRIDGVDPVFLRLSPEEIFFRAFRSEDFDICELSISSTVLKLARDECPMCRSRSFRQAPSAIPPFISTPPHEVNHKRLFRICREERLHVRRRGGRKRAIGT